MEHDLLPYCQQCREEGTLRQRGLRALINSGECKEYSQLRVFGNDSDGSSGHRLRQASKRGGVRSARGFYELGDKRIFFRCALRGSPAKGG